MTNPGPPLPPLAELDQAASALLAAMERGDHEARDEVDDAVPWLTSVPPKLFTLAFARLVIARQHGFAHWGELKTFAEALHAPFAQRVDRFIAASCSHEFELGRRLLEADHKLADANLYAAAVAGHVDTVGQFLKADPLAAKMSGGPRDRTPLSYLCFSRFLSRDETRQHQLIECAGLLLDAGADPNSYYMVNADPNARQTCLYGASGINNVAGLTALLLEHGADPNDAAPGVGPESLYHASEFQETECLRLILEAKPDRDKISYCLGRKLDYEDPAGVALYLRHGADPNFRTPWGELQTRLHGAIARRRSREILEQLLDAGADVSARVQSGRTAYAWAIRWGNVEAAELLLERGARELEASDVDRFLCACFQADEASARALLIQYPDLVTGLTRAEQGSLAQAALEGNFPAVKLMVELGFPLEAKGDFGSPVNQAAWHGNANIIEYLIERGANLEAENNFRGTALDCCVFGSANCEEAPRGNIPGVKQPRQADYLRSAQLMIAAGAKLNKVSPFPSGNREVDDLLRRYGRVD